MRLILAVISAAAVGLAAAGCQKKVENEVDQEALDQIAETVEAELNAPATAIVTLLSKAAEASQVGGDALVIGFDNKTIPVDWWLYRHGYVQMYGLMSVGRPALGVTQRARDEVAKGEPQWFSAEVGEPTRVDCATPDAVAGAGCEVEIPVTASLTDAGRAAIGEATLAPFNVIALVAPKEDGGWQVNEFRSDAADPADLGLNAILGPEAARGAARMAALSEMNDRAALTPEGQRQTPQETYAGPLPPVAEQPTIEAVRGGQPLGIEIPGRGVRP